MPVSAHWERWAWGLTCCCRLPLVAVWWTAGRGFLPNLNKYLNLMVKTWCILGFFTPAICVRVYITAFFPPRIEQQTSWDPIKATFVINGDFLSFGQTETGCHVAADWCFFVRFFCALSEGHLLKKASVGLTVMVIDRISCSSSVCKRYQEGNVQFDGCSY